MTTADSLLAAHLRQMPMKPRTDQAPIVICGDGSLNLLRCLAPEDAPIVVASPNPSDPTFYSRHCWRGNVVECSRSRPDLFIRDLLRIGRSLHSKAVIYYGDDATLLAVSRHRKELAEFYHFLLPDSDLLEALVDKMRFAELAAQCGLPVPATIRSSEIVDVEDLMGKVSLPCVLKPNVHIGWFQSQAIKDGGGLPRKVLHAQSQEDLRTLYEQIRQFTTDFVVQKYVPGGPDCVYSFHAYYNRRSEPMAYFVGRKIRSYPIDAGESTYIETVDEPEVVQLGLRILGALKFVGPVKLDFKKDWERNRFYLLEINARYNLWHYLGATCGINIPRSAYADLTGRQCSPATGYRAGLRWLSFSDDCRAFVRSYRPNGYLTLWQWLWSYRHPKIYNVFSWSDPYPLCVASFNWLKSKFLRPSVPTS